MGDLRHRQVQRKDMGENTIEKSQLCSNWWTGHNFQVMLECVFMIFLLYVISLGMQLGIC